MGLFLQTAIIKQCSEEKAREILSKLEGDEFELDTKQCQFDEKNGGVVILFNEDCICAYDKLAKAVSAQTDGPVMVLFIYDDDFWGYYLYQNGKELDFFMPMPDYFGDIDEVPEEEICECAGNSQVVAEAFGIEEASVKGYLKLWDEEMLGNYDSKAYEDDEFGQCDCWQMADFMRRLGFSYEW